MPANYAVYDRNMAGVLLFRIPGVLDPVPLTGVETSSGSNLITVADTANVRRGMCIECANIPTGAVVKAVKSATVLELEHTLWTGSTTQAFSRSAANAQATATATGLLAVAHGTNVQPYLVERPGEVWRNLFRGNGYVAKDGTSVSQPGTAFTSYPTFTGTGVSISLDTVKSVVSDELLTTPAWRQKMLPCGVWLFVCVGGHLQWIPADAENLAVVIEEPDEED